MGATLSKLWSSLRSAFAGGAGAGKTAGTHQHANGLPKDIESGTQTPARAVEPQSTMAAVKKYEITEVCSDLWLYSTWRWGLQSLSLTSCTLPL